MQVDNFFEFLNKLQSPLTMSELLQVMDPANSTCLFIKNENSAYCFANPNFIQLMGLQTLNQLRQANDAGMSKNQADAIKYRQLDECILEEGKTLCVTEVISPKLNQPVEKVMEGKLYPLLTEDSTKGFVLGIVTPKCKLLKLDFDTIFKLSVEELKALLMKRSYSIQLSFGTITLSKMEICTLIQMMKGCHAGEIATALSIKQTTVESYLTNIKNKLAVTSKSELITLVSSSNLLQQVIV